MIFGHPSHCGLWIYNFISDVCKDVVMWIVGCDIHVALFSLLHCYIFTFSFMKEMETFTKDCGALIFWNWNQSHNSSEVKQSHMFLNYSFKNEQLLIDIIIDVFFLQKNGLRIHIKIYVVYIFFFFSSSLYGEILQVCIETISPLLTAWNCFHSVFHVSC